MFSRVYILLQHILNECIIFHQKMNLYFSKANSHLWYCFIVTGINDPTGSSAARQVLLAKLRA